MNNHKYILLQFDFQLLNGRKCLKKVLMAESLQGGCIKTETRIFFDISLGKMQREKYGNQEEVI